MTDRPFDWRWTQIWWPAGVSLRAGHAAIASLFTVSSPPPAVSEPKVGSGKIGEVSGSVTEFRFALPLGDFFRFTPRLGCADQKRRPTRWGWKFHLDTSVFDADLEELHAGFLGQFALVAEEQHPVPAGDRPFVRVAGD
jgi:hypothetical protein